MNKRLFIKIFPSPNETGKQLMKLKGNFSYKKFVNIHTTYGKHQEVYYREVIIGNAEECLKNLLKIHKSKIIEHTNGFDYDLVH